MKTYCAVAVESESSGAVDWFYNQDFAKQAFEADVATIGYIGNDLNFWAFEMLDDATLAEITTEADRQMWERDYTAIESRPA